jgi:hypothetical protein
MNNNLIRSRQVSPLPVGPGGSDPVKSQMNNINTQLTMLSAQSMANTKYDPPVPKPITKAVTIENFTSGTFTSSIFIIGTLFIVYGLVSK